jgi:hypothetical protein
VGAVPYFYSNNALTNIMLRQGTFLNWNSVDNNETDLVNVANRGGGFNFYNNLSNSPFCANKVLASLTPSAVMNNAYGYLSIGDITCRDLQAKTIHIKDPTGGNHPFKALHTFQFSTNNVASSGFVQMFNLPQEYVYDPTGFFDSVVVNGDYSLNNAYWPLSATLLYNGATPSTKINQIVVFANGANTAPATLNASICFTPVSPPPPPPI